MEKIKVGGSDREEILRNYDEIAEKIGKPGASAKAAELIVSHLRK
jgi:hypothetical protein